jgi:hypothetical protein
MSVQHHTRQFCITLALIAAFGLSAYGTFYALVTPYATRTTEGFNHLTNSNKASASDSITVLSLGDKTPGELSGEGVSPLKKGNTLCAAFPRRAATYELFSTKITNTASQEGHTSLYDPVSKKLISIHPNERIELEYIPTVYNPKDKVKPTNISVRVFRYVAEADLYTELGTVYELDVTKSIESRLMKISGVKEKEKYIYKTGSTLVEVMGQKGADIQRVAEQVGGACDSKPVFDSGIPKGFVAWRTTDITREQRVEYVKIANADLTLHLETKFFGNEIRVSDNTESNNLGISEWLSTSKFRIFSIPTLDQRGGIRMQQSVHMFVVKAKDVQLLLNALKNRQTQLFGGTLVKTERDAYQAPKALLGKNVYTYERTNEDGETEIVQERVFVYTKADTVFAIVYDYDDTEIVESVINNIK